MNQYVVPYLMSSHPGSTLNDAIALALYLKEKGITPQQVQDFYPTPGTISTCMFYTGIDPFTMKKVYVPKTYKEKTMQRALLQYKKPENADLVRKALTKCGRTDLIGFGKECLVRPAGGASEAPRRPTTKGRPAPKKEDKWNEKGKPTANRKKSPTGRINAPKGKPIHPKKKR